jgi:hypothetical protein
MGNSKINVRVFVVHSLSAIKNEMIHRATDTCAKTVLSFYRVPLRLFSIGEISPFGFI